MHSNVYTLIMKTKLILLTSGLFALTAGAFAQNIKFQDDVRGSGEIERRTTQRIDRVQVKLSDDRLRSAEITFSGSRTERVTGRWYEARRDRFEIDLREAFGDRNATGSIVLELKNGKLERLSIEGDTRSERFKGSFSRGNANGNLDFRGDYRGEGNLSFGRNRQSLREIGLRLNKDGRFTITIPGQKGEISGNYSENRDGRLSLEINRAFDLRSVSGSGTMTLSRNRQALDRVDLNVRSSQESVNLNFRSTTNSTSSGGTLPGGARDLALKSRDGSGTWDYRREKRGFEDFEIKLERDGKFWARFDNNRRDEIRGTWTIREQMGKPSKIVLNIESAFGDDRARGSGDVIVGNRSDSFTVFFNGEANRNNFTVSYKVDDRQNGISGGDSIIGRSVICKGDGTQYVRNTKVPWKECQVRLNRNGDMEFALDSSSRNRMEGTYLRVRDGEYSFSVSDGRGLRLRGTVFTDRDNRSVRRITFEGTDRETDFRGEMTVRSIEESRR